jgi:hypothetical protein
MSIMNRSGGHGGVFFAILLPYLLLLLSLCGCAQFHPVQTPGTVIVRTHGYDSTDKNKNQFGGALAARVAPYALLAKQPYVWDSYDKKRPYRDTYQCDKTISGMYGIPRCSPAVEAQDEAREMRLLSEWHYVAGCDYFYINEKNQHRVDDFGDCPVLTGKYAEGLGVELWVRGNGRVCPEAAIVFRGTVSGDVGDWETNLHWFRRILPGYDQYNQVHDHIGGYLDLLHHALCYREGVTKIVAVGHSLGGGLAQLAAYSDSRIKRVYAIDPSMVIGTNTVAPDVLRANSRGIRMEYIYEHGEVLSYPRYVIRQFNPPTACNPRIVTERFKLLSGTPISQHSLTDFDGGLLLIARGEKPESDPFILKDVPPCADQKHS